MIEKKKVPLALPDESKTLIWEPPIEPPEDPKKVYKRIWPGGDDAAESRPCGECSGSGTIEQDEHGVGARQCTICKGTGQEGM